MKRLSISGKNFFVEELSWPAHSAEYITAWKDAFGRSGYSTRVKWLVGSSNNTTYIMRNESGRIVAGYSIISNHAISMGRKKLIGCCNNVFCIKEYQGLNLFVRLSRTALEIASIRYYFLYGFPNAIALPGHRRVGWRLIGGVSEIFILFQDLVVKRTDDKSYCLPVNTQALTPSQKSEIAHSIAVLAANTSATNNLSYIVRSSEFYSWRLFERPSTPDREYYVIDGESCIMLFSIYFPSREINILNVQASSGIAFNKVLHSLKMFALDQSIEGFKFLDYSNGHLFSLIKAAHRESVLAFKAAPQNFILNYLGSSICESERDSICHSISLFDNDVY